MRTLYCKNKKIKITIISLIVIFILVNISWFIFVHVKYNPYEQAVKKSTLNSSESEEYDKNFTYSVKKPDYLSLTGNLAVTQNITISSKGVRLEKDGKKRYSGVDIDAIIWPNISGTYVIVINIFDYNGKVDSNGNSKYEEYEFSLDENMKPIENYNEEKYEYYKAYIDMMCNKINLMWNINKN